MSTSIIVIRDGDFKTVMRSYNLTAILRYSREHVVTRVDCFGPHKDGSGQLGVAWADGATTIAPFASYKVMREWVKARRCFKHLKQRPAGPNELTVTFTEDGK